MKQAAERPNATCPECGAAQVDGLTCWEQLGVLLAWEWQDPALLAVHFLTVAAENLQHPAQFTDEALAGLQINFVDHLERGVPVAELRRRTSHFAEGATRVLKKESEHQPSLRHWSMTIANVYRPHQPQDAAEHVRAWAATLRREL